MHTITLDDNKFKYINELLAKRAWDVNDYLKNPDDSIVVELYKKEAAIIESLMTNEFSK